ncbi:MAG: winged helix-turn-helix domain-containing protein [Acidobacteriia bacterium]|nr:winged helix-turn-helix domain-containing protein [Terriglobia bacterium]
MREPTSLANHIRFGVFDADLRTGELRKQGLKLKLQIQPFRILAMLLERPGELVTREEIREALWPADTFIDFEHSVNSSIKKLREVLSDDAETPRYIETLPRRGYRFIAAVETAQKAASNAETLQRSVSPSSALDVGAGLKPAPASPGTPTLLTGDVGARHGVPLPTRRVIALAAAAVAALLADNARPQYRGPANILPTA